MPPFYFSRSVVCVCFLQSFAYLGTVVSLGFVKDPAVAKLLSTHIGTKIMNTLVVSAHAEDSGAPQLCV